MKQTHILWLGNWCIVVWRYEVRTHAEMGEDELLIDCNIMLISMYIHERFERNIIFIKLEMGELLDYIIFDNDTY